MTSSGLVYANRVGTATITARTKNGSARCKVTVKAAPDAVGSRTNPADPRNGVTIKKLFGTMYFRLNVVLRGEDAINKLKAMGEWSEYEQETYKQYHPVATCQGLFNQNYLFFRPIFSEIPSKLSFLVYPA